MSLNDPLICVPVLEDAIDRQPLMVAPEFAVTDAIALMSQTRGNSCTLVANPGGTASPSATSTQTARSSCVLVMRDQRLMGILTERDIVRLAAAGRDLTAVTVAEIMAHPPITLPLNSFQDIFAALFLFRRYRIRHLPIMDNCDRVLGVVSPESIRRVLRPANLLKLRRVADVMTTQIVQAPLTAPIFNLAQMMAAQRVSCVVITEQSANGTILPVGIVTERDIVQFQALQLDLFNIEAQMVMSTPLFLLNPEDSLWSAHQEMQQRHVRRLVVSWNWGSRLGLVTQTSLLRVFDPMEMYGVVETLQRTVRQLEAEKNTTDKTIQQVSLDRSTVNSQQSALTIPIQEFANNDRRTATARDKNVVDFPISLVSLPSPPLKSTSADRNYGCDAATETQPETLLATIQTGLESAIDSPNLSEALKGKLQRSMAALEKLWQFWQSN